MQSTFDPRSDLRSPREHLSGYPILLRLIDKIRHHHRGILPEDYLPYLLRGNALDECFLDFTGIDPETFRSVVLSASSDGEIVQWVDQNAHPHTPDEKASWEKSLLRRFSEPTPERIAIRTKFYPSLASRLTPAVLGSLDPFTMIDMDEGRIPFPNPE